MKIEMNRGNTTVHEHTALLNKDDIAYSYIIPASVFVGLSAGVYVVAATLNGGMSVEAEYTVAARPTLGFNGINPNVIELPISAPPLSVFANWAANGLMMNRVSGSSEITGTGLTAAVNRT